MLKEGYDFLCNIKCGEGMKRYACNINPKPVHCRILQHAVKGYENFIGKLLNIEWMSS
jgi:hypothetical protein